MKATISQQEAGEAQATRFQREGAARSAPLDVVPKVRLFCDRVLIDRGAGFEAEYEELEVALISLSFQYGSTRILASESSERIFHATAEGVMTSPRDREAEGRARFLLESLGAVDLDCLDDYGLPPDVEADYLVRLEGDAHAFCEFTARALPRLERMGFLVEMDERYPYQVVDAEVGWYATVAPSSERLDWFGLQLGVQLGADRIDLLPALLDMLEGEGRDLQGLMSRRREIFALPVNETHHVPVSTDRMRALLRVVIELYESTGDHGCVGLTRMQAAALSRLDQAFEAEGEEIAWSDEAGARSWASAFAARSPTPHEPPAELRATLRPYQREGLAWLQHLRRHDAGGILADDMGLGKTLQTIAHLAAEKAEGRIHAGRPALVVAPTSLVGNWSRELERFAPHLRRLVWQGPARQKRWAQAGEVDVILTSYPLLVRDQEQLAGLEYHLMILDEAHTIKNRRSQAHQACRIIQAEHRLCLTGTPVENHLGELWSLFDFLNPGLLGPEPHFRGWYRQPIERDGDEERLAALRETVGPYVLRRMKTEVARDLPPKTELLEPVELSGKQRDLYEHIRLAAHAQVRQAIKKRGVEAASVTILDALMKLRQVCCDPRLVKMDAARFVRESAKQERLLGLLDTLLEGGHRVLIFSQFTSMLALIAEALRERGLRYLSLTGATRDRQGTVDRFERGEAEIFLISLKAGGTGLNLVSADTVIHYDHWWNPQAQAQATDRAYRIGQKRPVFVHHLYVAGSVEERMLQLQERKRKLADALLGGGAQASSLSVEDIETLLAPLRD